MLDEQRAFWDGVAELGAEPLPEHVRAALAKAWTESAQMEHASIASFNRFALQLLAVGAPPELLESAQNAALDEIHHARIGFAIASQYARAPLGPAALDLAGEALGALDLPSVAAATVEEGCVGETLAALEAEAARDAALHPVIRAAWSIIALDEARHAELAWTFVRWALERGDPAVREAVRAAFEASLRREEQAPALEGVADAALAAHGRLAPGTLRSLRRQALEEVVRPALQKLF